MKITNEKLNKIANPNEEAERRYHDLEGICNGFVSRFYALYGGDPYDTWEFTLSEVVQTLIPYDSEIANVAMDKLFADFAFCDKLQESVDKMMSPTGPKSSLEGELVGSLNFIRDILSRDMFDISDMVKGDYLKKEVEELEEKKSERIRKFKR